jgi:hypothetical protein
MENLKVKREITLKKNGKIFPENFLREKRILGVGREINLDDCSLGPLIC